MKHKGYPHYKPSGIDWLGDIPEHWNIKRLRFAALINPLKSEVSSLPLDTEVSFIPMESVQEFGGLDLDQTRPMDEVYNGYTYFQDGDVVIAKITPCFENGKGSIAKDLKNGIGFGTTELHVVRPRPGLHCKFFFYLSVSNIFRKPGEAEMYGAGGQKRVPDSFIRNYRIPFPSIAEQEAITAFLDRETSRIDGLIEKKERQIELLQEKRAAIISHAVTKGLNPNVKLKPSGIDWLGDVPEHWESIRLKWVLSSLESGQRETTEIFDSNYLSIGGEHIGWQGEWLLNKPRYLTEDFYRNLKKGIICEGDVLLVKDGATIGKTAIAQGGFPRFSAVNEHVFILRHSSEYAPRFLFYIIQSKSGQEQIGLEIRGAAQPGLNSSFANVFIVPKPPFSEQKAIVDFLDRETSQIDGLIEKIHKSINLLREFRTALISHAVTGKIDVREEISQ